MEINVAKQEELDTLIDIWYEGSVQAHDFIDESYWKSQKQAMKETYLPQSKTYVIRDQSHIVGFLSMVDHVIAALFVDVTKQKKGYGKELLNFAKQQNDVVTLNVYKKNKSAIRFYEKNGFLVKKEAIDEPTNEGEYVLEWRKDI
ncbi:N-acetyltransferase [Geomicrobium sediminis]|uniref:Acetyltransferase n=1 Tax=Geomicrobium sediminis TaxID=1347788 RepID=A0ABS2PA66_9BACL|nr:N-acetyltransferase [Geomicrobium sediminis]MBM7632299.1 putative acetyltransferase [Geomicrobium sediminis]